MTVIRVFCANQFRNCNKIACFMRVTNNSSASQPTNLRPYWNGKVAAWSQKLWLPIVTDSAATSSTPPIHGFRQRSDLRRARTFLAIKQGRRVARREPQTRKKAQDQDNSSTQQTTTLGSSPSYAANQSISKSPSKAAIETVVGLVDTCL